MASRYERTPKSNPKATSRSLCGRINSRKRGGCQGLRAQRTRETGAQGMGSRVFTIQCHHGRSATSSPLRPQTSSRRIQTQSVPDTSAAD